MSVARRFASLLLLCTAFAAWADELSDVLRLQAAGDAAAALPLAERALAARPRDTQWRFVRAVLLTDLGRRVEAIGAFRQLIEDHPELAEPYNNLAALLAAGGDLDGARAELERALRARPDYATAHENLGDTYAMLAARAYAESARLDPSNRSAPRKLQLARSLLQAPADAPRRP